MENKNIVSIIVPVYNSARTLDKCISSLIRQTYNQIEIILVNDGSTDNSKEICNYWANLDCRIKVVNKINGGVSSARNIGITKASGKYIMYVDSDDYVLENYVEIFINAKEKYPNFGHYWCGIQMIIEDTLEKREFILDKSNIYTMCDKTNIQELSSKLYGLYPYGKLFDKEVILKNDIFMDEKISLGEDAIFNYQYLDNHNNDNILFINQMPYCYNRKNDNTLDTKYYSNLFDIYMYNNELYKKYLTKWKVDEAQWNLFYNSIFYNYERIFRNTFRKENQLSFIDKLKYNSNIMRTEEYKNVLRKFTSYIHPIYKKAYSKNTYIWVYLLDIIIKLKNKGMKKYV